MNDLRRALLLLGRYCKWQRSEMREMNIAEFKDYYETAAELAEEAAREK